MKNNSLAMLFLFLICGLAGCGEGGLKSGEVTQLSFTGDGKTLVVANEFRYFLGDHAERKQCHTRLRSWATEDWKLVGDTGELSLVHLHFAASNADSWFFCAEGFHRFGRGNPHDGPRFYQLNRVTLERKEIDVIQQGLDNRNFVPAAMACAGDNPLCVVHLSPFGGGLRAPHPAFIFDLRAGKKTVELQEFPTDPRADYFMKSVVEFVPEGKQIVSCHPCKPYQMQLHATDTGKLLKSIKLESPVSAISFSPNGKLLAAVCWDGTLLVFTPDLSKQILGKHVFTFSAEKYGLFPRAIAFAGDGHLAVFATNTKVELLDTKEWKSIHTFETENSRVNCIAGSPDGKLLAAGFGVTGSSPGFVRIWDVATKKLVKELK